MGTINHDAIIVTGFGADDVKAAQGKAHELGLPCSNLVHSPINGYVSFLIAPDGSKEWWPDSDKGNDARAIWTAWMRKEWNSGLAYVRFVHVRYGEIEAEIRCDGREASIDDAQGVTAMVETSQPDGTSAR